MRNQRGLTLIETLIVISILALFSSILLLQFQGMVTKLELDQFIDQLQRDINWALHYADINQKVVYLHIMKDRHIYYFQSSGRNILLRNYSNRFEIGTNLENRRLIIDATGLVSNFGTLTIYEDKKLIATLSIQMNTGIVREERY